MDKQPKITKVENTTGTERYQDVGYRTSPNRFVSYQQQDQSLLIHCQNGLSLEMVVVRPDIIRFRYLLPENKGQHFSYAVDPGFSMPSTPFQCLEEPDGLLVQTSLLLFKISKQDLRVQVEDREGQIIRQETSPFTADRTILRGTHRLCLEQKLEKEEFFFGLGDKSGPLCLNGQALENWNTDAFAYTEETDPLYKSIPFFYGLRNNIAYGYFLDNSYRSHFDFGKSRSDRVQISAAGGQFCYYFIYGPSLDQVAVNYAQLTGTPELPALWTLGLHQCRWSYYPDTRVKEIAREFRQRQIPCDAIYLDIDYMDGYRCFTWDKELFPDPEGMIRDLEASGFKTVVMIDPGIKKDPEYSVYQSGLEGDYFCRRTDGELMVGPVWPDECVFPDFTRPEVRKWWGDLYAGLYQQQGVAGFWNDMNEPAVFKIQNLTFPDNVRHHYEGHPTDHRQAHNVYGAQMARATQNGLARLRPEKRPFVITRATFSGGQRHAWSWTGDNVADWDHLAIANRQCQRLSISGYSLAGSDIGGFVDLPDGELFVRWMQLGIFHPLFRIHSMGNHEDGSSQVETSAMQRADAENRIDQEPWVFGPEYEAIARQAVELRYRLLSYWYSTIRQHTQSGMPVLRSLIFADPKDPRLVREEEGFLFGEKLLVYPVLQPAISQQTIYLPIGEWYSFWSGSCHHGPKEAVEKISLGTFPFFVRGGTVLPLYPVQQFTGEQTLTSIEIRLYYAEGRHESFTYEDAGEGYDYQAENYLERTWIMEGQKDRLVIRQLRTGHYVSSIQELVVHPIGLPFTVERCRVDGKLLPNRPPWKIPADFSELLIAHQFPG